ncbi:GRF1-interacting factor 3-like isoform X1 [Sesbania bispinosa]|nr:GRF1-interacting factor 3-like isoform X1 [Sesbania bispinosa]
MSQQQQEPGLSNSTINPPMDMNDQQQQQLHLAMSLQQPDPSSTLKAPFQMNEQYHNLPTFFQQQQLIPGPMVSFPGTNSGIHQASQTRLGNLPDTPSSNNQFGSDVGLGWS